MDDKKLVFISADARITDGEHYTLIADYFANFQHGIVSYLEGRSLDHRPHHNLTFLAIHEAIEDAIVQYAGEGDRYVVIAHGLSSLAWEHDKLMITKHAEDLQWSLDDIEIVLCSESRGSLARQTTSFENHFATLD